MCGSGFGVLLLLRGFGIGCCGFLLCLQAVVLVVLLLCAVLFAFAVWFGGVYVCFGC